MRNCLGEVDCWAVEVDSVEVDSVEVDSVEVDLAGADRFLVEADLAVVDPSSVAAPRSCVRHVRSSDNQSPGRLPHVRCSEQEDQGPFWVVDRQLEHVPFHRAQSWVTAR